MGKMQHDKGKRVERELVNLVKAHGLEAHRQPLSGSLAIPEFKNDVLIDNFISVEVKSRKVFSDYNLIETANANIDKKRDQIPALVKKGNNKKFLIELYLEDFLRILNKV